MGMEEGTGPVYKDRKVGLIVCGVVELLLGLLCLMAVGLMFLGQAMAARMAANSATAQASMSVWPMVLIYGGLAAFFVIMGTGSILARRWARALMLVASAYWLIMGVLGSAMAVVLLPRVFSASLASASPTVPGAAMIATVFFIGFFGIFFVALPGVFVLFYRSPHVKATCERQDRKARWTDRAPLPVLGLSMALAGGGLGMLTIVGFPTMPLFGTLATGPLAIFIGLLGAVLFFVLAVYAFRLQRWAWTGSLVITLLWSISSLLSSVWVKTGDLTNAIAKGGVPSPSAQAAASFMQPLWGITAAVSLLLWLGYLLYVQKYFRPDRTADSPQEPKP